MAYKQSTEKLAQLRNEIAGLRARMRELQAAIEPEKVADYQLRTAKGPVRLSELFGDKQHLFVIHNMGASCVYCTLWADGFNGVLPHLENRAAFVISSPDEPSAQQKFKDSRGWKFRMVSHKGTNFAADMGYARNGDWIPGVSVFTKSGGNVMRVSDTRFGPGDDFCGLWHLFDMIPEGRANWQAKYKY